MRVKGPKYLISNIFSIGLISIALTCTMFPSSSKAFVDEEVDDVSINIPSACTMSGSGMNSHTAEIPNGTYRADIGTTTINAYCNDPEGFAIYAIGYTDNTDGINVLKDSTLSSTFDIVTGTATSGNTSNWAMKLSPITNPTPTYPITIESDQEGSFSSYHSVPSTYTKVAKRTSSTDVGENATGTSLTTTYASFIGPTQAPGTYVGQVKYVMVRPNYVDNSVFSDAVTVVFDGNGLTFPDGSTTNTVKYANVCKPAEYGYVGSNYQEVMTSNITTGGVQNGAYTDQEYIIQPITFSGADKLKVVVDYALTANTAGIGVTEGNWNGDWSNRPENFHDIYSNTTNISSIETYIINSNTVTINIESWGTAVEGYNKGAYIKVYPVYNTEQPGTTLEDLPVNGCSIIPISGAYTETTEWHDKWYTTIDNIDIEFKYENNCDEFGCNETTAEESLFEFVRSNYESFKGTTLTIYAYNPVTFDEVYLAANKAKTNGYYVIQDLSGSMCSEVSEDETSTVIDTRDNNTYGIIKASDGNCWLRDNLKLDPTESTVAANMSSSNTNATDAAISNYLHGGNSNNNAGWTSSAVINVPADGSGGYGSYVNPYINNGRKNLSAGVYYNFCAASVGTYCYLYVNQNDEDPSQDLCPRGWHLPTRNEWATIDDVYTFSQTVKRLKVENLGSFSFSSSEYPNGNRDSVFWSSTKTSTGISTYRRSNIDFEESMPAYQDRTGGYSVRCILSTQ